MKLFKKMVALVAVAACSFAMTAPMSASAAQYPNKHNMQMKLVDKEHISSKTVSFVYMMDVDNDGFDEVVVDFCTEVTYEFYYEYVCTICGYGLDGMIVVTDTTHSAGAQCPNYNVGVG